MVKSPCIPQSFPRELRGKNIRQFLLNLIELKGTSNGLGGTTAQLFLIVDVGTIRAEIDLGWSSSQCRNGCSVKQLSMIW